MKLLLPVAEDIDRMRRTLLKLAVAGTGMQLGGALAWAATRPYAADRDTLVIGVDKNFASLNGVIAGTGDSDRYGLQVFDKLYTFDAAGLPTPELATAVDISADGLRYTYHLRRGVKFQNHRELTSADVKFTMEFALDPINRSARRPFFAPSVDGVETPDPYTAVFRLKIADAAFANKIAGYLPILPKDYGSSQPAGDFFARSPIGAGPYRVKSFSTDNETLELERFDDYWGPKPSIRRLVFKTLKDEGNRVNALLAGEVDVVVGVPYQDFARLQNNANVTAVTNPAAAPFIARPFANDPKLPYYKREVRQALNYAIDKDAIVKSVLHGIGEPLASGISRYYPYGSDSRIKPYPYDPKRARELLTQAGFANGFDTQLIISSENPRALAEAVAAYWGQVGVRAKIQVVDYASWVARNNTHMAGPVTIQQVANAIYDPIHPVTGLYSKGGSWSDYSNPEIEQLLTKLSNTPDRQQRDLLFQRIDDILHDDAAAIYISEILRVYARKRTLQWAPTRGTAALDFRKAAWS
ncbi:MAG: ABC transporter substrate-binding protein [Janthinobacterium lividum]